MPRSCQPAQRDSAHAEARHHHQRQGNLPGRRAQEPEALDDKARTIAGISNADIRTYRSTPSPRPRSRSVLCVVVRDHGREPPAAPGRPTNQPSVYRSGRSLSRAEYFDEANATLPFNGAPVADAMALTSTAIDPSWNDKHSARPTTFLSLPGTSSIGAILAYRPGLADDAFAEATGGAASSGTAGHRPCSRSDPAQRVWRPT